MSVSRDGERPVQTTRRAEHGQRRQGIATALFPATIEVARRKGYEKIFTFVRADNPAALATYRANGFSVVGIARRHAKIDGQYVDEILIERILTGDYTG